LQTEPTKALPLITLHPAILPIHATARWHHEDAAQAGQQEARPGQAAQNSSHCHTGNGGPYLVCLVPWSCRLLAILVFWGELRLFSLRLGRCFDFTQPASHLSSRVFWSVLLYFDSTIRDLSSQWSLVLNSRLLAVAGEG
jgi:hypothetical protein